MHEPSYDTDLTGKIAIVTGANSGIGKQIALNLGHMGATVVMACRDQGRGSAAAEQLRTQCPQGSFDLCVLDQSSQESIRSFVEEFHRAYSRLDILINNAGIYPASRQLSADGIELTWATNVMGYFLLSRLLEPTLRASAPARLLFVASSKAGNLDMDDLQWQRRKFGGIRAYEQSKQANRMLAWVFADKLEGTGVAVNVVHPGGVNTGIGRGQKGLWGLLVRLAFKTQKPVSEGADTATWLASSPEAAEHHGGFWADRAQRTCEFRDMAACRQLWHQCEQLIVDPGPQESRVQ